MLAAAGCLFLCVRPVRPRIHALNPLSLRIHELVGWLVLLAAVLHVLLLLIVDRTVIEHVKLTAPPYESAGALGLLLLLFLTAPSTGALRRRLWSRHRNFQALHVSMTCLLVALVTVHIVTTSRYVHGHLRTALYVALRRPRCWRSCAGAYRPTRPSGRCASFAPSPSDVTRSSCLRSCWSACLPSVWRPPAGQRSRCASLCSAAASRCVLTSPTTSTARSTAYSATTTSLIAPACRPASVVIAATAPSCGSARKRGFTISASTVTAIPRRACCSTAPSPAVTPAMRRPQKSAPAARSEALAASTAPAVSERAPQPRARPRARRVIFCAAIGRSTPDCWEV